MTTSAHLAALAGVVTSRPAFLALARDLDVGGCVSLRAVADDGYLLGLDEG